MEGNWNIIQNLRHISLFSLCNWNRWIVKMGQWPTERRYPSWACQDVPALSKLKRKYHIEQQVPGPYEWP